MRKERVVVLLEEMQSNFTLVLESHRADTESNVADGYRVGRKPSKDD